MRRGNIWFCFIALALGLAAFLAPGAAGAEVLQLGKVEIRDPQMNNTVAARVALPQGWAVKEQRVPWNMNLYGDPAHVLYILQGPADEVEFAALSRLKFGYNQSWLAMADYISNEMTRQSAQMCQSAKRFTPAFAPQMCAKVDADLQQFLQKTQQDKAALLSGQTVEDGLTARQPMWAADVAQLLLQQNHEISDVRVKKIERPADLEALLRQAVAEQDAQARQAVAQLNLLGAFKGLSFDVARVYFNYAKNGKRYDGVSLVVTRYLTFVNNQKAPHLSAQSGPDPMYGKEFVIWEAHINAATGLAGRLEAHEAELTAIAANSAIDPVWQTAVDKFAEELTRKTNEIKQRQHQEEQKRWESEMAHQQKMQQMRMDTLNYINRNQQEVFARRSQAQSNVMTGWTDTITDRQRWQGSGDKYVAPNDYKYAWEGSDGKTAFSNDSNFNPNNSSGFSGNWTQMRKVPW